MGWKPRDGKRVSEINRIETNHLNNWKKKDFKNYQQSLNNLWDIINLSKSEEKKEQKTFWRNNVQQLPQFWQKKKKHKATDQKSSVNPEQDKYKESNT